MAGHDRGALDQFGKALDEQHGEAHGDQQLRRPLRQAARIHRLLADGVGAEREGPGGDHHHQAERQQEGDMAEHVDPVARALLQRRVDDVDADVFVLPQRPGGAEQEHGGEQHPLQFEPRVGTDVEQLADDGVDGRHQDRQQDQPGNRLAQPRGDRVDQLAGPHEGRHHGGGGWTRHGGSFSRKPGREGRDAAMAGSGGAAARSWRGYRKERRRISAGSGGAWRCHRRIRMPGATGWSRSGSGGSSRRTS